MFHNWLVDMRTQSEYCYACKVSCSKTALTFIGLQDSKISRLVYQNINIFRATGHQCSPFGLE